MYATVSMADPKLRPESDEALMVRFSAGDEAAFELLFERYGAAVRAFLARLARSDAVAADLAQETFVSMVRGRGRFVDGSQFRPWLFTIALNAFRDHHRHARREVLMPSEDVAVGATEPVHADPGLERQVREAVASLPEAQRDAIVLHRFHDLGFVEIGARVGMSETAVKVRAHRGYARLRRLLGAVWSEYVE